MKEFINRKKVLFISIISVLIVITGLYSTYAINAYLEQTTPTTYDMALSFDLSDSLNMQVTVEAGKTKVFDIEITNPYTDSIQYGIAYQMISPTTKPDTLTIAQANISPYPSVWTIAKNTTQNISLVVENKSTSSVTISFSVITGYKNGGDLIVPSGKTLVTDIYELRLQGDIIIDNMPISTGTYIVDTSNCTDATMTYDYSKKGFKISNVSTEINATCAPSITSTTRKNLASYIKDELTGTPQGDGQVVNEIAIIPDYSVATSLSKSEYGTPSMYYSSSYSSTSGTDATSAFTFSNGSWSTVPANMTSRKYYHFQVTIPSDGYYQLCYTMSSGYSRNSLYLYKNTTSLGINGSIYVSASTSAETSGCEKIGSLSTTDSIRVVQEAYSNSSYPIATVSFYLKKTTTTSEPFPTGYRYEGKNPNNYVLFNDELWRIIGVFDETSHGQNDEYLTKIIREERIGGHVFDKNDKNNWAISSLYNLLNGAYYNAEDGTDSGYCYCYSTTILGTCDYRVEGIQKEYRSMVKNVTWYLGGNSSNGATAGESYTYERSSDDIYYYTDNRSNKTVTGNIGLMYVSDYGYSVLSSSCSRSTLLSEYNTNTCASASWLKDGIYELTIGQNSKSSSEIIHVDTQGFVNLRSAFANQNTAFRPVLYLDSSVYIINGTGSKIDPYIIGL